MRTRTLLAACAAIGAGAALARRARRLIPVLPELRRPLLLVPLAVGSERVLRLVRRADVRPKAPLRSDVRMLTIPLPDSPEATLYLFEPKAGRIGTGALLWIHGGGYIGGSALMDRDLCAGIAADLGIIVAAVEYRLAPDHPFPAPLDDCAAALRWLHANAEERRIDPRRIAIGGASAGGGLAAALVQRAIDEGTPVAFQLLEYPMLDDRTVLRADDATGHLAWTRTSNRFGWRSYLGHEPGGPEDRPYAAPGRRQDLRGLPPAWIGVGELDLFREEDVEYARRLRAAGVETELVVIPGMYHGADAIAGDAPAMRAFRARMIEAVRTAVG